MTTSEIKSKIAESKNKGWYQSLVFSLKLPHVQYNISLTGLAAAYDYVLKQCKRFDEFESLPEELKDSKRRFQDFKLAIVQIINDDREDDYKWKNSVSRLNDSNAKVFPSDIPETDFLVNLHINNNQYYKHAYDFIINKISYLNKDQFTAYVLAYESLNRESSKIAERSKIEQKSIAKIKTDFQKQVSESEVQLTEYLATSNDKVLEISNDFEMLLTEKKQHYASWHKTTDENFRAFFDTSKAQIKEAEDLYKEKLKMEAPAQYWNQRAIKLRKEGFRWLYCFLGCIAIACAVLIWVLGKIADGTLQRIFSETSVAIKWSIVLITLISFLAYGIKIFSKLTFSSFHLVRDAEEREQLTYVYLALQKEKGIDQTERHLIMQSLFSRADSGLLRDDSGPTMPGNIVDQVIKK